MNSFKRPLPAYGGIDASLIAVTDSNRSFASTLDDLVNSSLALSTKQEVSRSVVRIRIFMFFSLDRKEPKDQDCDRTTKNQCDPFGMYKLILLRRPQTIYILFTLCCIDFLNVVISRSSYSTNRQSLPAYGGIDASLIVVTDSNRSFASTPNDLVNSSLALSKKQEVSRSVVRICIFLFFSLDRKEPKDQDCDRTTKDQCDPFGMYKLILLRRPQTIYILFTLCCIDFLNVVISRSSYSTNRQSLPAYGGIDASLIVVTDSNRSFASTPNDLVNSSLALSTKQEVSRSVVRIRIFMFFSLDRKEPKDQDCDRTTKNQCDPFGMYKLILLRRPQTIYILFTLCCIDFLNVVISRSFYSTNRQSLPAYGGIDASLIAVTDSNRSFASTLGVVAYPTVILKEA